MRAPRPGTRAAAYVDELIRTAIAGPRPVINDVASNPHALRQQIVDLSTFTSQQVAGPYFGVTLALRGSALGAILTLKTGNGPVTLRPGDWYGGRIENVELAIDSTGANSGNARLMWATQPGARFEEPPGAGDGAVTQTSYSAAYNVTTNTPSLATDGISLAGANGVRALVAASGANTISAGSGRWWGYSSAATKWGRSPVNIDLETGVNACELPDAFVTAGYDRAFLEVLSGTNSGGSGAFTVYLTAGA